MTSTAAKKHAEKYAHPLDGPCDGKCSTYATIAAAYDAGAASVTPAEPITYSSPYLATAWLCVNTVDIPFGKLDPDARQSLAAAFDAIIAPAPAPVLLTADDPRWRDGAKARGVFEDGTAVEGIVEGNTLAAGSQSTCGIYRNRGHFAAIYLLAEAPDPDADTITMLAAAACEAWGELWPDDKADSDWYPAVLATIRAKGYDVVKRADA